jgi:NADH-quinone oxidoreductase subunit I
MGYLTDSVRALAFTMKSAFRKPVTVQYPAEKRERAVRYRNSFALLHDEEGEEACVGCLQCEKICPSEVITVIAEKRESASGKRRGFAKDFTLDLNACIFCELCVQVCPTDAIVMMRQAETPAYSREDLVLTMEKLYANEHGKPRTWGKASVLMEMQDPKRGQAPAEKPAPAPKAEKPAAADQPAAAKAEKPAAADQPAAAKAEKPAAEAPAADKPAAKDPEPAKE